MLMRIALASLNSRRASVLLTVFSIMISVSLLLGVETVRSQLKQSFTRTVSGVDLIVGAPTGDINLLLYSVFRIGNASSGVDYDQAQRLEQHPLVEWLIPLSLGDSHQGFRVVGTDNRYFDHYRYGQQHALNFAQGQPFEDARSAVLGSQVAAALGYTLGEQITLGHGLGNVSFQQHDAHPFTVVGILAATGTSVDKAVHVPLSGIEQMHQAPARTPIRRSLRQADRQPSNPTQEHAQESGTVHNHEHKKQPNHASASEAGSSADLPDEISAMLVGLTSRAAALQLQYQLNQQTQPPVKAILPGMTLMQLWQMMSWVERLLLAISALILVASLTGLITMLLASMRERRHEIAVLRAIGAGPGTILWLVQAEALLISGSACALAFVLDMTLLSLGSELLSSRFGLFISGGLFSANSAVIIACVMLATWLVSLAPAIVAYRQALHAGLSSR